MGYQVYYTIPNIDLWAARFKEAPALATVVLNKALQTSAVLVESRARQLAPVKTGYLRGSIHSTIRPLKAIIFTNVKYAEYVERGTGLYGPKQDVIRASDYGKKVFATKQNPGFGAKNAKGYWIIGSQFKGQKANPFMETAYEESKEAIKLEFAKAGKEFIAGLSKK